MTVQYDGCGCYSIDFGSEKIQLTEQEINEIQNYDFGREEEVEPRSNLEYDLEVMGDGFDYIGDKIGNIEELMDDEDTEPHHLIRELEDIKRKIGELR